MRDLALFPLNTVLFPGTPIQLHIFEERYLLMVRNCLEMSRPFGVVLIRQGAEALGPLAVPYGVGCSANIVDVEHLEDGQLNITAIGDERFRIHELDRSHPYLIGKVETLPLLNPTGIPIARGIKHLRRWMGSYLGQLTHLTHQELDLQGMELPDDPLLLLHLAAAMLQVPMQEKQNLLSIPAAEGLLMEVIRLYRREISVLDRVAGTDGDRAEKLAWLN